MQLANAEKEKIASQLSALQQKVNPHFLYNCLSVLSELVYENPDKANKFIKEFSNVYRYVLDNSESLVTLQKELDFLDAYLYMQKIRFGESLHFEVNLKDESLKAYIPTLSLQLVVENAIKHNRISKSAPLVISIHSQNNRLVIKNNLQLRIEASTDKKLGLRNLTKTYRLISGEFPTFKQTETEFIAEIPLLEKTIAL